MLISKPSDFVKSYNHKDTSETNVAKLVEHLNSLSVNERRENLLFLLDQDFDVASNKKWLSIYKEDLNYIAIIHDQEVKDTLKNMGKTSFARYRN